MLQDSKQGQKYDSNVHIFEKAIRKRDITASLRELQLKDAPMMLEWMHDSSIVCNLKTDFTSKTIKDCEEFIKASKNNYNNLHRAIVDATDQYVGTVSLKNINRDFKSAEFAIVVLPKAMGKGYSSFAMKAIIQIGFEKINLDSIYWCVSKDNFRAIKFYDENGYKRVEVIPSHFSESYTKDQIRKYHWYMKNKLIN